jgi:hypothetical protein
MIWLIAYSAISYFLAAIALNAATRLFYWTAPIAVIASVA